MILTLRRCAFRFWEGSDVAKALSTVRTKVMGGSRGVNGRNGCVTVGLRAPAALRAAC